MTRHLCVAANACTTPEFTMNKASWEMLERLFTAKKLERLFTAKKSGTLPLQTKSKAILTLEREGLAQRKVCKIGGLLPEKIEGWVLTSAGHARYCEWAAKSDEMMIAADEALNDPSHPLRAEAASLGLDELVSSIIRLSQLWEPDPSELQLLVACRKEIWMRPIQTLETKLMQLEQALEGVEGRGKRGEVIGLIRAIKFIEDLLSHRALEEIAEEWNKTSAQSSENTQIQHQE